jgi:hypothetical protein
VVHHAQGTALQNTLEKGGPLGVFLNVLSGRASDLSFGGVYSTGMATCREAAVTVSGPSSFDMNVVDLVRPRVSCSMSATSYVNDSLLPMPQATF